MKFRNYPELKNEIKIYQELEKKLDKANNIFLKKEKSNGCAECIIHFQDRNIFDAKQKFLKCGACKHVGEMKKLCLDANSAFTEFLEYEKNVLPKPVFEVLIKIDPNVYSIRTKKTSKFSEVFGKTFEEVDPKLYSFLVGLISIDGGVYKIVD